MINLYIENDINGTHLCNLIPLNVVEQLKDNTIPNKNTFLSQMHWLTREDVELNFCTKNDIQQNNLKNIFFPVELYWSDAETKFYVDTNYLKNTNAVVFIWWPKEPFTNSTMLRNAMNACGHSKIVFVTGNLNKADTDLGFPNVTYKGFDYWWFFLKNFMVGKRPKLNIDKVEKYEFTFFNRRLNLHRSTIYYRMLNNGSLNNAKHSYHATYKDGDNYSKDEVLGYLHSEVDKFKSLNYSHCNEFEEIIANNMWYDWVYDRFQQSLNNFLPSNSDYFLVDNLHNESYLDVITESCVFPNDELLFITEKTYRSIANGCIFLILGSPGTLKYLHSKGIQTFNDIFDESYDDESITHWFDRWKIIEKNLKIWHNLGPVGRQEYYKKSFDKLVHNHTLLYNRSFKNEIRDLFKDTL